jgi:hypothetical protein
MKTTPVYKGNILTEGLQSLADGTLFYEHVADQLEKEQPLYKKVETLRPTPDCPGGDVLIEPMTCGQFSEVPGERHCLGYQNDSEKEWRVVSSENLMKMVGWLMTTSQYLES